MTKYRTIQEVNKAVAKELQNIRNNTIIEIFNKLVEDSPYGDPSTWKYPAPKEYQPGHFKANWQASKRNPKSSIVDSTTLIPTAEHLANTSSNETIYICNNVPYAERLENGWSKQRPSGWVRRIMAMGQSIIDKLAREAESK